MALVDELFSSVAAQIEAGAAAWLEEARGHAARSPRSQLLSAYTEASRHLGRAPFVAARLTAAYPALSNIPVDHWTLEDAGRLALLLAHCDALPQAVDEGAAAAIDCYEQGDTREQLSWLRTVALLPDASRFLAIVIDACRTSILPLFEAAACENTYPASHFPERNFNQMVLKALFNDISLNRIVGLPSRLNAELSRMAGDYAAERRAAGRPIPRDIALAMASEPAAHRKGR
jgi:hypothetical protein